MGKEKILEIKNLNISFLTPKGQKRIIVENGELEICSGELVLIVGENGSGKSSVFKQIVGDSSIEVSLFNKIIRGLKNRKNNKQKLSSTIDMKFCGKHCDIDEFRRQIGYSEQIDDVDTFTSKKVWDHVLDYASWLPSYENFTDKELQKEVDYVYEKLDCDKYCEGNLKKMRIKKLSGGEKKITSIMSALSRRKAKLFILDEPINNLDGYHARQVNNYLVDIKRQEHAPGILIITHCPVFVDVDKVYLLKKGKLIYMDKTNPLIYEKYYKPKGCYGNCNLVTGKYEEEE